MVNETCCLKCGENFLQTIDLFYFDFPPKSNLRQRLFVPCKAKIVASFVWCARLYVE